MTYSLLGWINVILLGILVIPYVLNFLNKKIFKTKNKTYFKIVKSFRKFHKPLGLAMLIIGPIHGYMALGGFKLHTGTLFYISILLTGALGGSFYKTKKKVFFTWHKRMAFVTVALLLLHLFAPSAIYYMLN